MHALVFGKARSGGVWMWPGIALTRPKRRQRPSDERQNWPASKGRVYKESLAPKILTLEWLKRSAAKSREA